ncbi:hypothetical protein F5148DRAFT_1231071 [Russula earlei]|uniref:Uncharacterized protein n=1 Tax=Russula earlei TaxID=71964 RepID=A0ACC0U154_9AGAM|nr:hypothetical protein F5148DRAFT_1231071 [Russula earlei]
MRTSSIFAIFCLAIGILPSLALPNPSEHLLSESELKRVKSRQEYLKQMKNHKNWEKWPRDLRENISAEYRELIDKLLYHKTAEANRYKF